MPLPTIRRMAAAYDCDPGTVQRAYQEMLRLGTVSSQGIGRHQRLLVAPRPQPPLAEAVAILSIESPALQPEEPGWSIQECFGAMAAISTTGATVLIVRPQEFSAARLTSWCRDGLAGVILLTEPPAIELAGLNNLMQQGLRVAALDHILPGLDCDRAGSDHQRGGRLLADHLIAQGRRRLVTLWPWSGNDPDDFAWAAARQAGLKEACLAAGIPEPIRRVWTNPIHMEKRAAEAVQHLRDLLCGPDPVDALLVSSDGDVPMIVEAVVGCGGRQQPEVVIAGYDDYLPVGNKIRPCATIDKRNAEIGAELVRLVQERRSGRLVGPAVTRLLVPRLVVG